MDFVYSRIIQILKEICKKQTSLLKGHYVVLYKRSKLRTVIITILMR